jgi:hypothetical protein
MPRSQVELHRQAEATGRAHHARYEQRGVSE